MSLENPYGDGLLRTTVTWDDIQKACKEVFGQSAVFGPNKKVTSIGNMRGFMGKVALVDPDWLPEHLYAPKKFVVKIVSHVTMCEASEMMAAMGQETPFTHPDAFVKFQNRLLKLHNNECTFYETLEKHETAGLPIPKVFFSRKLADDSAKGFIIMEHVEGDEFTLSDNLTIDDIHELIRSSAVLTSIGQRFSAQERSLLDFNVFENLYEDFVSDSKSVHMFMQSIRKFGDLQLSAQIDQLEKIAHDVLDTKFYVSIPSRLGMHKVLSHSDLWTSNAIFNRDSDNKLELRSILDFQTVNFGVASADLVRLICANLSGKDRRDHLEGLIDRFYAYLLEEVPEEEVPYSLEQFRESVLQFLPFGAFLVLVMIGPLTEMLAFEPGDKQEKSDRVLEKTKALVEDIIVYHERNRKIASGHLVD